MADDLNFDTGLYNRAGSPGSQPSSTKKFLTTVSIFLATAVDVAVLSSNGSFFPEIAAHRGLGVAFVGIIMSAVAISSIALGGFAGRMLSIIGARFLVLAGMFTVAGSTMIKSGLLHFGQGIPFVVAAIACNLVTGAGFLARSTGVMAMISADFEHRITLYMGLYELSSGIGASIGPVIGGAIFDSLGFKYGFLIPGMVEMGIFALVYWTLNPSNLFRADEEGQTPGPRSLTEMKKLLRYPPFYFTLLTVMTSVGITVAFGTTISIYTTEQFKLDSLLAGIMIFLYHGTSALVSPIFGIFADRKGYHETMLLVGHLLSVIGLIFLGPIEHFRIDPKFWITSMGTVITAAGCSLMFVPSMKLLFVITRRLHLTDVVTVKSIITSAIVYGINIGSLLGPLLGASLVDVLGFRNMGLYLAIISAVIAVLNLISMIFVRCLDSRRTYDAIDEDETRSIVEELS